MCIGFSFVTFSNFFCFFFVEKKENLKNALNIPVYISKCKYEMIGLEEGNLNHKTGIFPLLLLKENAFIKWQR